MIQSNLDAVMASVRSICQRAGRAEGSVTVVGVTKYSDASAVNEAMTAGLLHIAENRVQSAKDKFPLLNFSGRSVVRHLIGHLQTNKAKEAVQLFDLIQSVDSLKLVQEIDKRAATVGKVQDVLLQIDIAREEQKFGLPEEELGSLLAQVKELTHVRVGGLMCMAPLTDNKDVIRQVFRRLKAHFDRISKEYAGSSNITMQHLSMGMSGDYEIAIEEGATMVRIGSAIFKV
ncbi:MAG: YggS family pyridoxal phosphate-dependent enzyme [Candidatus Omnitrophica bacterium]|nr:YggS family pyridoxal phosphate-dependent enzyme [Candidatus Omnitrophota bacterium]